MKTMELFGNIYEEVESNSVESQCSLCALLKFCMAVDPDLPCERADGSVNRYFVLVNEKSNDEE